MTPVRGAAAGDGPLTPVYPLLAPRMRPSDVYFALSVLPQLVEDLVSPGPRGRCQVGNSLSITLLVSLDAPVLLRASSPSATPRVPVDQHLQEGAVEVAAGQAAGAGPCWCAWPVLCDVVCVRKFPPPPPPKKKFPCRRPSSSPPRRSIQLAWRTALTCPWSAVSGGRARAARRSPSRPLESAPSLPGSWPAFQLLQVSSGGSFRSTFSS